MSGDLVERVIEVLRKHIGDFTHDGRISDAQGEEDATEAARAAVAVVLDEAVREAASVSNPFITNREQFSRCMGWTEAQDEIVHAIRALKGDE